MLVGLTGCTSLLALVISVQNRTRKEEEEEGGGGEGRSGV